MDQIRDQKIRRSERWRINENGPTQEISALLLRTFFDAALFFEFGLFFRKARMSFAFGRRADIAIERRNVRFGSEADICSAKGHVRFTPESGH